MSTCKWGGKYSKQDHNSSYLLHESMHHWARALVRASGVVASEPRVQNLLKEAKIEARAHGWAVLRTVVLKGRKSAPLREHGLFNSTPLRANPIRELNIIQKGVTSIVVQGVDL